jgi:putative ABC transport system permease protein
MRRALGWLARLLSPVRPLRTDDEIAAELESHIALHVHDKMRSGMTLEQARSDAWMKLGGMERTKDDYRDQRGVPMFETLSSDIRYGLRRLLKSPGFSCVAIVILGLGIGANAAIFSVVNAVVLQPLPYPDASRIVRIWHTPPAAQFGGLTQFSISPANYFDWKASVTTFAHMAIYGGAPGTLVGRGEPVALRAMAVTGEFFQALGASPLRGRLLDPADDDLSRTHVVVVAEHTWKGRFGGDPAFVGQAIRLGTELYTVVGIMPDAAAFPEGTDLWQPLVWRPGERNVRGNHNYLVIGRLRPTADLSAAQAELTTISQRLERLYPEDDKGWGAVVLPLHQDLIAGVRWELLLLLGAVVVVLLIACANLANLLLARVLGRSREIAIRTAIGASQRRVIQQLLVESALLGLAGGAVGLLVAVGTVRAILGVFGTALPRASQVGIDGSVLAFTSVIAMTTGLLAGVAPAWRMTRGDAGDALKQGMGRAGSHAGERRVRNTLVTTEVALALVLLVGAGLLIRTLAQLQAVNPGFDPRNVITMAVGAPPTRYPQPAQRVRVFDEIVRRVRTVPGVDSVATTDNVPLTGGSTQPIAIEGETPRPLSEQPEIAVRRMSPNYISTLRMHLVEGRDFTETDGLDHPLVVIVSASTARRFWPNRSPVGQHLILGLMSPEPREVVGVVSDVKIRSLTAADTQTVYVPSAQGGAPFQTVVVRTGLATQGAVSSIVGAIHTVLPDQPVLLIRGLDEVVGASIAQQRFTMQLLTTFAALALLLAAVGIYGVLSYTVRQRIQEIGIRMALGAARLDIVRLIVIEGLKPTGAGLVVGIVVAAALGRLLSSLVFGVTPHDTLTFAAVSIVVVTVGVVASLLPAYRATRVDPLRTLRAE